MTGKDDERGLDEIRRMLRGLDEISAAAPKPASAPPPRKEPVLATPLRPVEGDALSSLSSAPAQPRLVVPPPPSVTRTASPSRRSASPGLFAVSGLAVVAIAGTVLAFGGADILKRGSQSDRPQTAPSPRVEAKAPAAATGSGDASPAVASVATAAATGARSLPPTSADLPTAPILPVAQPREDITIAQAPSRDARAEPPRAPPVAPSPEPSAAPAAQKAPEAGLRAPAELTIRPNGRAPLQIDVSSALAATQGAIVLARGLPTGASLTRGRLVEGGLWAVTAPELQGLELLVGDAARGVHELAFELRGRDGAQIGIVRTSLIIVAPGAPAPMADSARPSDSTLAEWVAEGKRLIGAGHIASARLILERAADGGNAEAARTLGDTFDPAKLYVLGVRGIAGDLEKAVFWYERADELGDSQAKARLLGLSGR